MRDTSISQAKLSIGLATDLHEELKVLFSSLMCCCSVLYHNCSFFMPLRQVCRVHAVSP